MANPSRVSTLTISGATGSRTWTATAAVQDTAAGSSVVITLATSATGATPPVAETAYTLNVKIDNVGTVVRAFTPGVGFNGTQTFFFTVDGVSASAVRAGLVRLQIVVAQTGGLGATQYSGDSDVGGTPPATFTFTQTDSGYIRGTTTATTTLGQGSYAYGDTITATTVLGAAPFQSRTVTTKVGALTAVASAASTTATFTTAQGLCDNRFPASSNSNATITTVPNASLVATPWTTLGTPTETSATVDPRLTVTHLMQVNDNTFGTPPISKDVGGQRLSSDLAFLDSRFTNASGTGVNSINFTVTLQDALALVTALTRTTTSATMGGEAGWGTGFLAWDSALPTGTWNKTTVINSPAAATGLASGGSKAYSLVAANPNLRLVAGAGPATAGTDSRHFSPGVPLLIGVAIFNTNTNMTVPADTGTAKAALGRFSLTLGRAEFLDSDGVWKATNGVAVYYWTLTVSPGDSNVFIASFADTSTWGVADMFVIGKAQVAGVPVSSFQKEITVNGVNNHTAYEFDGPGFLGFPSR